MSQLQPNPGTWKDKEEFPFMSEQGVRGTTSYQVTYYTQEESIKMESKMETYKGYKVIEEEINGQVYDVLNVEVGCQACEDQVQPGHFACSTTPKNIRDDKNISFHLMDNRWVAIFNG